MCFGIHKDHLEVKIATKNIKCYKRLKLFAYYNRGKVTITRSNIKKTKFYTPYQFTRVFITLISVVQKLYK